MIEINVQRTLIFKRKELNKDFQFKVKINFAFSKEIRQVIVKHTFLKSKSIKLKQNERIRIMPQ